MENPSLDFLLYSMESLSMQERVRTVETMLSLKGIRRDAVLRPAAASGAQRRVRSVRSVETDELPVSARN